MAMLDIEYRFSNGPLPEGIRRKSTKAMESYIRDLVFEMQSADISVKFETGFAIEGERNMVFINGRTVPEILDGLNIVIPDADESSCGCDSRQPVIAVDNKPTFRWNEECIEDIPDVLMKNAIAKVYADMESNRIL